MITNHNELDKQLRESKLKTRMDREEFERLLQAANQCKVALQKEEENKSFSHQEAHRKEDGSFISINQLLCKHCLVVGPAPM